MVQKSIRKRAPCQPRLKVGLLHCWRCKEYKPPTEFYKDKCQKCGRSGICRTCSKDYQQAYQRRYYLEHRDILLPRHRLSVIRSNERKKLSGAKTILS